MDPNPASYRLHSPFHWSGSQLILRVIPYQQMNILYIPILSNFNMTLENPHENTSVLPENRSLDFRRFLLVSPWFLGAPWETPHGSIRRNIPHRNFPTNQRTPQVVSEKTLLLRWTGRAVTWRAARESCGVWVEPDQRLLDLPEAMLGEFDPRCCRRFLYVHPDS